MSTRYPGVCCFCWPKFGYPFVLKAKTDAYDGRGNYVVKSVSDIPEALEVLKNKPLYAEKFAKFERELAVMVIRTKDGKTISYPAVETVQKITFAIQSMLQLESQNLCN